MKILITGAKGFVGRNLAESLKNVMAGRDRTRSFAVEELYEYDVDSDPALLPAYCREADFVFHLAGVNRPKDPKEFMAGNYGFTSRLLGALKEQGNRCPVMLASSIQATLIGRYGESLYGRSKLAGEELFFDYARETGAGVLVYRFPNLFGKWCRPNYNSVVATFCHNIARDLPIEVNDPSARLELLYIDDLVNEMLDALEGRPHRCGYRGLVPVPDGEGRYCHVPVTHQVTLGEVAELLHSFRDQPDTLMMPSIPAGSFAQKLYSTYLSYLPPDRVAFSLKMNRDARGSFTELVKTREGGQMSVNISGPGVTKGQHWHHSKWELFIVVKGRALIRERRIGTDPETGKDYPVHSYEVTGEEIRAVHMLPGYTHDITNLSDSEDLVTVMWANEAFDPERPDTFFEKV